MKSSLPCDQQQTVPVTVFDLQGWTKKALELPPLLLELL